MIPITVISVSARLFVTYSSPLSPLIVPLMFVRFSGHYDCSHASLRNRTLRSNHSTKDIQSCR